MINSYASELKTVFYLPTQHKKLKSFPKEKHCMYLFAQLTIVLSPVAVTVVTLMFSALDKFK